MTYIHILESNVSSNQVSPFLECQIYSTSSKRFEVVSCTFVLQGDCISSNGAGGKIPFCESKLARHKKERFGPEIKDKVRRRSGRGARAKGDGDAA